MRPCKYQVLIREITKVCAKHDVSVEVIGGGGGSHRSLVFTDNKTGRAVNLSVAKHREVSAGVQHKMLQSLARYLAYEAVRDLAELLIKLLRDIFNGAL